MEERKAGRLDSTARKVAFQPSNLPTFQFTNLPLALGLFLFSIYLLSFSGKFHVMDELAVFTAGHNLGQYGRADINQLIWTNHWTPNPPGIWGSDGNLYTKKPPGISFITAPLIWLGHTLPGLNAVHVGLLTNALVTALTASLLFIWLTDLGFTLPTATLTTLGYGLCTIAWVYARMFWESSLLALFILAAVWAAYRATHLALSDRQWRWLLLCGLAVAVSLTLRFEAAIALGLVGLYLAGNERAEEQGSTPVNYRGQVGAGKQGCSRFTFYGSRFTFYLTPSLLIGLVLLYFNYIRYGSLIETGYTQEILFKEPWVGAYGLLFSPGRGLFIYSPLLLLLFFGLRPAWRRLPRFYFWLIAALCLCYWLFYGSWFAWGGAWGWGPRFLLPILPLLMVFVAEAIEAQKRAKNQQGNKANNQSSESTYHVPRTMHHVSRFTFYVLTLLSLIVNLLGLLVDFNEHFLRLGTNDNFVFNWAVFPPLAHWQILQEGLVDLIWLQPQEQGLGIVWPVLLPGLALFGLASVNLALIYRGQKEIKNEKSEKPFILHSSSFILPVLVLVLTYLMLRGTAQVVLATEQAQFDQPVLQTLEASTHPGDAMLMPMPPFGDVQEISTHLMASLSRPLPNYAWIESDPRAIKPEERERVWQAVQSQTSRLWLFERWLTQGDPPSLTATRLNREAFPLQEQWFAQSGRLTLYTLAGPNPPSPTSLNIPFQGGLTLLNFSVLGDMPAPGEVLKLRLTWQAAGDAVLPPHSLIAFAQIVGETEEQNVAQVDRLLVDLQNFQQSPLLPGQIVQQGYGLQLPSDLSPGAYSLVVGVYQAGSGQRLPRADGSPDDFLYLATLQILPE